MAGSLGSGAREQPRRGLESRPVTRDGPSFGGTLDGLRPSTRDGARLQQAHVKSTWHENNSDDRREPAIGWAAWHQARRHSAEPA